MGSSALVNLQFNTKSCIKCLVSRTNLLVQKKKTHVSMRQRNKVNIVICYSRFPPPEDIRDMQRQLGIGGGGPVAVEEQIKVVEEVKQDTQDKGAIYNFFYPDKELLPEDKEMSVFDHLEEL
ncbi:sec-independent protein translocase protein TATC, chloroplastic-like [Bidens hawaiensis]|uniref:sec-independent protein translocase protein TATC, chloroplastic-like n=1 Tax=Bidens hawaiensis TaxID=980011 RepID=UPI00404A6828